MPFSKDKPFNDLPALPPAKLVQTPTVLKKCITARAALAELKGIAAAIPNPQILLRTIGIQEARLSSEIENIVTTTDELYQAFADSLESVNPSTKEVMRYHHALQSGMEEVRLSQLITTNLFCKIASTITQCEMNIRAKSGTKIAGDAKRVIYTPPDGQEVIRTKLKNLERFIHEDVGLDPLIKMAIIHYQFEAIHPFTDGNGRTGRIINVLYLIQQGLLDYPILYLSSYLIRTKNEYYAGLRGVTEEEKWEEWILYVLTGIEETAISANRKIFAIKAAMDSTLNLLKERLSKIATKDLVELLFYYPYCKSKFLEDHYGITRQTAATYLKSIEELGILKRVKSGREMYYINIKLIDILLEQVE